VPVRPELRRRRRPRPVLGCHSRAAPRRRSSRDTRRPFATPHPDPTRVAILIVRRWRGRGDKAGHRHSPQGRHARHDWVRLSMPMSRSPKSPNPFGSERPPLVSRSQNRHRTRRPGTAHLRACPPATVVPLDGSVCHISRTTPLQRGQRSRCVRCGPVGHPPHQGPAPAARCRPFAYLVARLWRWCRSRARRGLRSPLMWRRSPSAPSGHPVEQWVSGLLLRGRESRRRAWTSKQPPVSSVWTGSTMWTVSTVLRCRQWSAWWRPRDPMSALPQRIPGRYQGRRLRLLTVPHRQARPRPAVRSGIGRARSPRRVGPGSGCWSNGRRPCRHR
jgi:hypothetical protein